MTVPAADGVSIRTLGPADTYVLDRVDEDVFDGPVRPDLAAAYLANPANLLVVAVEDGTVVGMASGIAYLHPDKPLQLFVNEVGVAGRCRRRGIGSRLIGAILVRGREMGCTEAWVATEEGNAAARGLYASAAGKEDAEYAVVYTWDLTADR